MSDLRDRVEKLTQQLREQHAEMMKLIHHQAAQIETLLRENEVLRHELALLKKTKDEA